MYVRIVPDFRLLEGRKWRALKISQKDDFAAECKLSEFCDNLKLIMRMSSRKLKQIQSVAK